MATWHNRSHSPEPPEILRRSSRSYLLVENDCSSATSWEFHGLESSPTSSFHASIAGESCSKEEGENRNILPRVSMGRKTGSHLSQDSGLQQSTAPPRTLSSQQEFYQQLGCENNTYVLPDSRMVGSFKSDCCGGGCIYDEVILAQSEGSPPIMTDVSIVGAPTCCSTPKELKKKSRVNLMEKIDNFESLNKNVLLDSNNNSNNNGTEGYYCGTRNVEFKNQSVDIQNQRSQGHYYDNNGNVGYWPKEHIKNGNASEVQNGYSSEVKNGHSSEVKNVGTTTDNYWKIQPKIPQVPPHNNANIKSQSAIELKNKFLGTSYAYNRQAQSSAEIRHANPAQSQQQIASNCPVHHEIYQQQNGNGSASHHELRTSNNESSTSGAILKALSRPVKSSLKAPAPKDHNTSLYEPSRACIVAPSRYQTLPHRRPKSPKPADPSTIKAVRRCQADNESLRHWLHDLRSTTEAECLNTLQMKAIIYEESEAKGAEKNKKGAAEDHCGRTYSSDLTAAALAVHSVSASLLSVRKIERMASIISGEFSKICKHLEFGLLEPVPNLVESLAWNLEEFLGHLEQDAGGVMKSGGKKKLENWLASSSLQLQSSAQVLRSHISLNRHHQGGDERQLSEIVGELVERIVSLGNLFGQVVDGRLTRDLSGILEVVQAGELLAGVGLKSFVAILSDGTKHICRLAASVRTVRVLLGVLLDQAGCDNNKVLALRCLATVLCAPEAVTDFDQAGGFELLTDILCDSRCPLPIKFEAVAVLAQATDPWIDLEASLTNLSSELERIIYCLIYMIPQCQYYEDSFLLIVAALSNLTFLETSSIELIRHHRGLSRIIKAVKAKPDYSVFVLDHVATILANATSSERCRKEIVRCGGVISLLCFIQQGPSPMESAAEIAACERLQQRSTAAISRLCAEDGVPELVTEMGGLLRMVQLCRREKERNYSDGVLIACLATVRKLAPICKEELQRDLEDLTRPKLLDAFLMFSSRQESYV